MKAASRRQESVAPRSAQPQAAAHLRVFAAGDAEDKGPLVLALDLLYLRPRCTRRPGWPPGGKGAGLLPCSGWC